MSKVYDLVGQPSYLQMKTMFICNIIKKYFFIIDLDARK